VYDINGYIFYTKKQDKKNTYQNSGVRVDAYDVMRQYKNMYYGQIQEIWDIDFHGFKISLFRCNWIDAINGVVKDKYGFISFDLNYQGYKLEPFMLVKHVATKGSKIILCKTCSMYENMTICVKIRFSLDIFNV
jgi:hypothetical protein